MILAMSDLELENATQMIIDFMREHPDVYNKENAGELGAILGNVMFVLGQSYDAWLHASDAIVKDTDTIDDMINKGKGINTDNN